MGFLLAGFGALLLALRCRTDMTLHARLVDVCGGTGARIALPTLALGGTAAVIHGYATAAYRFVWLPPAWTQVCVLPLMYAAFICIAAAMLRSNLRRLTRRPLAWGVALGAVAHALVQEDLAALTLFGGVAALALIGTAAPPPANRTPAGTCMPPAMEVQTVALGGVLFIIAFLLHAPVFGIPPSTLGRAAF